MDQKPSNKKMEKYRIMRLLYWGPQRYTYFRYTQLPQERIIRAIKKLLTYGDIKKKKIYLEPDDNKAIKYYHDNERRKILGVKEKTRGRPFTHEYRLTKQGKKKLAFYHYNQYHKEWQPRIEWKTWQDRYVEEITEFIMKQNYYR